jgi:cystathionine beta-lyase/cystathionine gamma-synthase
MNPIPSKYRQATCCVHAGTYLDPQTRGVCSPIFTSSAYGYPNDTNENVYPRYFNVPNQRAVAAKLAALEQGEDALVFSSGMAAISTVLLAHLNPGDHALFQADLYGGTFHFISAELRRLGIDVSLARTPDDFSASLRPNTRLIYVESPSNPLLRCVDLESIGRLGRSNRLLTIIDNTFATPINQNPITLGIDVVIHSGTKYLSGHSDLNCGAAIASHDIIRSVASHAINLGGTLDAHACYTLERSLKTLALRVARQNDNASRIAQALKSHPAIARVHYPGLPAHPDHHIALRQMRGFGGMLSFELKDPNQLDPLLNRFQLVTPALSLGGVETLICVPSRTSHVKLSRAQRESAGISENLIRVSVGIEDVEDLLNDFQLALDA